LIFYGGYGQGLEYIFQFRNHHTWRFDQILPSQMDKKIEFIYMGHTLDSSRYFFCENRLTGPESSLQLELLGVARKLQYHNSIP
jgi:hypothetical protein